MDGIVFREAVEDDILWLIERHAVLYDAEAGFDATFAPVVATALATYFEQRDPAIDRSFVPERDGERLGSLFVTATDTRDCVQLRLFWLEPHWRGKGLAQKMLDRAVGHARALGCDAVLVRTYDRHVAAGRLYARSGFKMTDARPVRAYGQELTEQSWRLEL